MNRTVKRSTTDSLWLAAFLVLVLPVTGSVAMAQTPSPPPTETTPPPADVPLAPESNPPASQAGEETEAPAPLCIKVAGESIQFTATGEWKSVPPRSNMLEAELKIPRVGEDEQDGRLTIMGAGGTIEANITRWQGQFTQTDGSATTAKTEKKQIADRPVTLVDISGTFLDAPGGPFGGQSKIERTNYRMLAAIIETEAYGNYFVKLYGPKATIDANETSFKAMIDSLAVAD